MNFITLPNTIRFLISLGFIAFLNSCSNNHPSASVASATSYAPASGSFRNAMSSATRVIVKTGSIKMDTNNVRETGKQIEQITSNHGGHILNLNERDDTLQNAIYSLLVPAQHLVEIMDQIDELGKVTYRHTSISDRTKESIAFKARLNKLKQRKKRLQSMYYATKNHSDKLDIEKTLADIEEEIFSMEEAIRQLEKFAHFSKLNISLSQKTIRGPVGATLDSARWTWGKLFTIRE